MEGRDVGGLMPGHLLGSSYATPCPPRKGEENRAATAVFGEEPLNGPRRHAAAQADLHRAGLGWWRFVLFFPILWTILTSFKPEAQAIASPPVIIPSWTLENYIEVQNALGLFPALLQLGLDLGRLDPDRAC